MLAKKDFRDQHALGYEALKYTHVCVCFPRGRERRGGGRLEEEQPPVFVVRAFRCVRTSLFFFKFGEPKQCFHLGTVDRGEGEREGERKILCHKNKGGLKIIRPGLLYLGGGASLPPLQTLPASWPASTFIFAKNCFLLLFGKRAIPLKVVPVRIRKRSIRRTVCESPRRSRQAGKREAMRGERKGRGELVFRALGSLPARLPGPSVHSLCLDSESQLGLGASPLAGRGGESRGGGGGFFLSLPPPLCTSVQEAPAGGEPARGGK